MNPLFAIGFTFMLFGAVAVWVGLSAEINRIEKLAVAKAEEAATREAENMKPSISVANDQAIEVFMVGPQHYKVRTWSR